MDVGVTVYPAERVHTEEVQSEGHALWLRRGRMMSTEGNNDEEPEGVRRAAVTERGKHDRSLHRRDSTCHVVQDILD